jgi:hypothetical protein
MKKKAWTVVGLFCVLMLFGLATKSEAFFLDENKSFEISAKAQTRATVRLQDTDSEAKGTGFCFPDIKAGDFVQHRNMALVEIDHDLENLTKSLDVLYPFRALGIDAKYHIVGRFLYDGIYDYGPEVLRKTRDADRENVDKFKQSYDLWECYADLSRGPVFFRIGRQSLAWGETDIFRLLDGINPLDNTFGGPFEDLDDRRIPLWMLRSSLNLGLVGPISSLTLEGFIVPGKIDARVAPAAWLPDGGAYEPPVPRMEYPSYRLITPSRNWAESRWGVRLQGLLGSDLNFAVAHYQSFLDAPFPRVQIDEEYLTQVGDSAILLDNRAMQVWWEYPEVRVTGASMNYFESMTNIVFRGEVSCSWNEPIFIPEINMGTLRSTNPNDWTFVPQNAPWTWPEISKFLEPSTGVDLYEDMGWPGLPKNPKSGTIPRKDILRYMIGFDKQIWIRPLNGKNMFFLSGQYFGQYVPGFDERMRLQVHVQESLKEFIKVKRFEHVFTLMVNSLYMKGSLQPQIAAAYDVRGAVLVQPSINYVREPFRFTIQYSAILGKFVNFGVFRDRDQVSFMLTYLLS